MSLAKSRKGEPFDYLYKIVVIGDSGVGKSNIILRFAKNEFNLTSKTTIGVEFSTKSIKLEECVIKLQVWDTAGQERYRVMSQAFYRNALGALIVYDIASQTSFDNCSTWINEVMQYADQECQMILVGNKSDLSHLRMVPVNEGRQLAEDYQFQFIETSAMTSANVEDAFERLATTIYKRQKFIEMQKSAIHLDEEEEEFLKERFEKPSSACSKC